MKMSCYSHVILFIEINFTLKIMDMRLRERKQSVNASASSKIKTHKSSYRKENAKLSLTRKLTLRHPDILQVEGNE